MTRWTELVEHMKVSAMIVSIVPESIDGLDEKLAREVGLAIHLDKPIILLVREGTPLPTKLLAVADRVVTVKAGAMDAEAQRSLQEAASSIVSLVRGDQS